MRNTLIAAALGVAVAAPCSAGNQNQWNTASDLLAVGLPALAAGYTAYQNDLEGGKQLAWSLGAMVASTQLLKSQVSEMRPDQSDNRSFPSGHTAVAFSSARYLHKRYGESLNPYALYGAAGLTALARVQADKHHWKDTIAGGAIGYAWSEYFTESRNGRISLLPAARGVSVAWQREW